MHGEVNKVDMPALLTCLLPAYHIASCPHQYHIHTSNS